MKILQKIQSYNISVSIKQVLIAGFFLIIVGLISNFAKPNVGRYVMLKNEFPIYHIFDTATGKIYYWNGAQGLHDIDDPINNRIINVINRKRNVYLPHGG